MRYIRTLVALISMPLSCVTEGAWEAEHPAQTWLWSPSLTVARSVAASSPFRWPERMLGRMSVGRRNTKEKRRSQLLFHGMLFLLIALQAGGSTAFASAGYASIGLRPALSGTKSYFVLDSKPGATMQEQLLVANTGTKTGVFSLYSVDATTGITSGTVYEGRGEVPSDVGKWLHLAVSQLTLEPGQRRVIDFSVAVPTHVRDGQHVGGIVATLSQAAPTPTPIGKSGFGVKVNTLTIMAVQVNLPGPQIEDLQATGCQIGGANGYQSVQIGLRNAGNVMLKPAGALRIMNTQRAQLQQIPINMDTFLPDTAIEYPAPLQKIALGPGTYICDLTLAYGDHHVLHYSAPFTISPQAINKIFQTNPPLARPDGGLLSNVPLWSAVPIGLFLLAGISLYLFKISPSGKITWRRGKQQKEQE